MDLSKIKEENIPKIIKILGDEISRTRKNRKLCKNKLLVFPQCKTEKEINIADYFYAWHSVRHKKFRMIIKDGQYQGGHVIESKIVSEKYNEVSFEFIKRNYINHQTIIRLINKLKSIKIKKEDR